MDAPNTTTFRRTFVGRPPWRWGKAATGAGIARVDVSGKPQLLPRALSGILVQQTADLIHRILHFEIGDHLADLGRGLPRVSGDSIVDPFGVRVAGRVALDDRVADRGCNQVLTPPTLVTAEIQQFGSILQRCMFSGRIVVFGSPLVE